MVNLKTKWFNKWAKKNSLSDENLLKTIENLTKNTGVVNLGSGLFKIRNSKVGRGKSGGFRTILVYRKDEIAIFIYGFSKTDKDNLDNDELKYFKKLAKDLLSIDNHKINDLEKQGSIIKIKASL
jgi:hypothetical protein